MSLVFYPGHLGATTQTLLREPNRAMRWTAGQVREVREPEAADYVRLGGFLRALSVKHAAQAFKLRVAQVRALADDGEIDVASFVADGAEEGETVAVLSRRTIHRLQEAVREKTEPPQEES